MAETEAPKPEGGSLTMGDLRRMVEDTIQSVMGAGKEKTDDKAPAKDAAPTGGLADQVRREVERIRAREAREARDKEIDTKLGELEERTKPKPETTPVERSRVHRIMGWGE